MPNFNIDFALPFADKSDNLLSQLVSGLDLGNFLSFSFER